VKDQKRTVSNRKKSNKKKNTNYLSDLKRADRTKLITKLIKQELIRGKKI